MSWVRAPDGPPIHEATSVWLFELECFLEGLVSGRTGETDPQKFIPNTAYYSPDGLQKTGLIEILKSSYLTALNVQIIILISIQKIVTLC